MDTYAFKARLVDAGGGEYEGNPWLSATLRLPEYGLAKFKVNVKKVAEVKSFIDKDVRVECEIAVFNNAPILRIVSLSVAK